MLRRPLEGISKRDDFGVFCNQHNLLDTAVEVGMHQGAFAAPFLSKWKGACYVGVDTWRPMDDYAERLDWSNAKGDREADYRMAQQVVAPYGQRATLLRATSEEAAKLVPDGLDFVYIDANHAYEHVKWDIALWWPKVRPGGMLAGHDYDPVAHEGVVQAVDEFAATAGVQVWVVNDVPMWTWVGEIQIEETAVPIQSWCIWK